MTPTQDEAFTAFLRQKAAEAHALGYRPTQFTKMLNSIGGKTTVNQLLSKGQPTDGFMRLWKLGRLDLTVEALAVESSWRPFIDPALLDQAEKLLRRSEYSFKPFVEPLGSTAGSSSASTSTAPASTPADTPPGILAAAVPAGAATPASPSLSTPTARAALAGSRPPRRLSFSAFCESLGAPLGNMNDRWCGYNPKIGLGVFNLWADRLQGDHYRLWTDAELSKDTRIGARELRRVLRDMMAAGHAAYGILSEAEDIHASTRHRIRFDDEELLALKLEADGVDIIARVVGMVSAADVAAGRRTIVTPFDSAINDLNIPPSGQNAPRRTPARIGTGYRRDPAVRDYVLARAKGRCEHCGMLGFEMDRGYFYLEAHHVITLAARGPDTVVNVIALCANHHRQAHYGKDSEALEAAFLDKLRTLNGG